MNRDEADAADHKFRGSPGTAFRRRRPSGEGGREKEKTHPRTRFEGSRRHEDRHDNAARTLRRSAPLARRSALIDSPHGIPHSPEISLLRPAVARLLEGVNVKRAPTAHGSDGRGTAGRPSDETPRRRTAGAGRRGRSGRTDPRRQPSDLSTQKPLGQRCLNMTTLEAAAESLGSGTSR